MVIDWYKEEDTRVYNVWSFKDFIELLCNQFVGIGPDSVKLKFLYLVLLQERAPIEWFIITSSFNSSINIKHVNWK